DYVPNERKSITVAHLSQNPHKDIPRACASQKRQTPIATARDEMQVSLTVDALQSLGHKAKPKAPPLGTRKGRGTRKYTVT
ncbi:MAG: hypothetical protein ACREDR_49650, partial [Blastocatellia bacterium]